MTREKSLFGESDPAAEAAADADLKVGRVVGHDAVRRWIASLCTDAPLLRPRAGD